jgi:hypothetical protein
MKQCSFFMYLPAKVHPDVGEPWIADFVRLTSQVSRNARECRWQVLCHVSGASVESTAGVVRRERQARWILKFERRPVSMLHKLGRFLQFVGLFIIMPAAMAGQIVERAPGVPYLSLGEMLVVAIIGMIVFYIGRNLLKNEA